MSNQVWFSILLLIWCAKGVGDDEEQNTCDTNRRITEAHVVVVTGDHPEATTVNAASVCMRFNGEDYRCQRLGYLSGFFEDGRTKGNWWTSEGFRPNYGYEMSPAGLWNDKKVCDIRGFKMKSGGHDAWLFGKLIVLVKDNHGQAWVVVNWNGGKMLSHDTFREHAFDIEKNIGEPNYHASAAVRKVVLLADTTSGSQSGSAHHPNLYIVHDSGARIGNKLPNNIGDDMMEDKTDVWVFADGTSFSEIDDINKIREIYLNPNGPDGWRFDHVAVMIDTEFGWYVPVLDLSTYLVDKDGRSHHEHVTLNMLNTWKGQDPTVNTCTCDSRGIQSWQGSNWCWVETKSCMLLDGSQIDDDWTWLYCEHKGAAQMYCPVIPTCTCDSNGITSWQGKDWCYVETKPCLKVDGSQIDDDWTWLYCEHEGVAQMYCPENYEQLCNHCGCSNGVEGVDWKRIGSTNLIKTCYSLTIENEFCGHEFILGSGDCFCRSEDAPLCDQKPNDFVSGWGVYEITKRRLLAESPPKRSIEIAGENIDHSTLDN